MRTVCNMLRGDKLAVRLGELSEIANSNHSKVISAWHNTLEYAKQAGEALQEAYERLGRRGRWGRWLSRRFEGSSRTAREYRRVFRQWNHPRLQQARSMGMQLNSIQAVLRVLRAKPLDDQPKSHNEERAECARKQLRKEFARLIKALKVEELEVLVENFEFDLWCKLYADLQFIVCAALEFDVYGTDEKLKVAARAKVSRALQARSRSRPGKVLLDRARGW